jgi:hypothetical protein
VVRSEDSIQPSIGDGKEVEAGTALPALGSSTLTTVLQSVTVPGL